MGAPLRASGAPSTSSETSVATVRHHLRLACLYVVFCQSAGRRARIEVSELVLACFICTACAPPWGLFSRTRCDGRCFPTIANLGMDVWARRNAVNGGGDGTKPRGPSEAATSCVRPPQTSYQLPRLAHWSQRTFRWLGEALELVPRRTCFLAALA